MKTPKIKMVWNTSWLPNDEKPGSGWLSVELLYPSPDYRGAPMVLMTALTKAYKKEPCEADKRLFVDEARQAILDGLQDGLDAANAKRFKY